MPALARRHRFGNQVAARRQIRPAALEREQRRNQRHLGRRAAAGARILEFGQHRIGQFARERHARAGPARHGAGRAPRRRHKRGHFMHTHELKNLAGKGEHITLAQASDEVFFDRAQLGAVLIAHQHRRFGHDRADREAVPARDLRIGAAIVLSVVADAHDAPVFRIRAQRFAAARKLQHPAPFFVGQMAIAPGGAHLGEQLIGGEPGAQRDRHNMLRKYVERFVWSRA